MSLVRRMHGIASSVVVRLRPGIVGLAGIQFVTLKQISVRSVAANLTENAGVC